MKLPRQQSSTVVLSLIAFLAVLLTIAVLALTGRNDAAILTGLIGVLGSFRPWNTRNDTPKREGDE